MIEQLNLTAARARLRRHRWICRQEGPPGALGLWDHNARGLRIMHAVGRYDDGQMWEHFSLSREDKTMPGWEQLRDTFHEAVGDEALGLVVIPPKSEHINQAEVAHVWRCLTARPIPDFTRGFGTI